MYCLNINKLRGLTREEEVAGVRKQAQFKRRIQLMTAHLSKRALLELQILLPKPKKPQSL